MTAAEATDGFVYYVPITVDPGPILLIATIATTFFILAVLPIAVVLGDKYEELEKRFGGSDTDEDDEEGGDPADDPSKIDSNNDKVQRNNTDESSVSSKGTYYSAISDAVKEILDQHGRPIRSGQRHRRRYRTHLERLQHDPAQQSMHFPSNNSSGRGGETGSDNSHDNKSGETEPNTPSTKRDPSETGRAPTTAERDGPGIAVSFGGSIDDGQQISEYSASVQEGGGGGGSAMKVEGMEGCDKPRIDRNACLSVDGFLDEIAAIMAWDVEMRRIIKLSIPFATQALFTGTIDTSTVGVIGTMVGTREVSAFVVVNLLIQLTTKFVGGFHEALVTLCSQAIGAEKNRLAGKYVQIAVILYTLSYIPFAIFWVFFLDDAIRWFGFDEETVQIGHQYGYLLLVDYLIDGLSEAIHGLLDVSGFENFGTTIGCVEELIAFLTILIWALVGSPTLLIVGLVQFGYGVLFLFLTVAIIWWKGWFLPYRSGMFGTFALSDKKAVQMVCKTAASLSFGYLLTDGEWEILTIFASFLGPAEVAAWGIFGSIWDAVNELIDGISDASEVRCAFLLGSDQPERARLSAYKSMMICLFTSLFTTSVLFMCGEDLPTWLTSDPTLQRLLLDLLPMFGLGNAAMCLGAMSWTLLGSQGRYRLATVVVALVSWFFTLPLSAVMSIHLRVSLEGQTATVVLGYIISGAIHSYFLFRSDWVALSKTVMEDNCSRASDDSSLSKDDVPTKVDDYEDMSEQSLLGPDELDDVFAQEATSSPSETSQRGNLPRAPSSRAIAYQTMGLPNPPSGEEGNLFPGFLSTEGSTLLYTSSFSGEWNDAPSEEVEVEIYGSP